MAIDARSDLDRSKDGVATGNVLSGANTLSGAAGKDGLGVAPNRVSFVDATMVDSKGVPTSWAPEAPARIS